jgi:subtilisin family serine protease
MTQMGEQNARRYLFVPEIVTHPMRTHLRTRLIALAGSAVVVLSSAAPVTAARPEGQVAGATGSSWIVMLAPGHAAPADAPGLTRDVGGSVGLIYAHAINGFQFKGSAAAAAALERNPKVLSVTPDHPVALTEVLPTGVERISAFDEDTPQSGAYHNGYRGNGARVAVLDTGIDMDHPDLVANIDAGSSKNCINPSAAPNDGYGHGTHVAGTVAAPLNGGPGVVGVAPEADLVAVKIFDDAGNSSESLVLCGFDHVMSLNADADSSNDIDVMNMSFGEQRAWGSCLTDPLHAAVCSAHTAGVIMVAGSGNSAVDAGSFVPAAFPEVISVSALTDFDTVRGGLAGCKFVLELFSTECDDTLALFSNHGASVDVVAPGVFVYSTWIGGTHKTSSGTSMATPHVAGVTALMAAAAPGLTPAQAMANLLATGECPDGTVAGADGSCAGQGTWPDDPDGIPEPMIHALRAAVASGNPAEPTAPGAPNLTAASAGNASVALSWTAPASDGGSPLTGYEVWRGTTSGAASLLTTLGMTTSYTDTDVSNGSTYYYQVAAVNAVGTGAGSNERSATPLAPPAPTAPGAPNLTAASAGNASVALSWTAPASDGGSPLTGYEVWRGTTSGAASLLTTLGMTTSYTDTDVSNGSTYYYQVAAVNAVGTGAGSNERSATPTSMVPVARLGGAASNFASAKGSAGSMSFSLPAGTDRLVAMISVSATSTTVSSMTWKPDPSNPALNQPLTRVGRQAASGNGAVEIWELADPTPGVAGAALSHTLNASVKRVMGVHFLDGVGGHGTAVGSGVNGSVISVDVPSQTGALVLDVLFAHNSTLVHTTGAGQFEHWNTKTTGGVGNLLGAGSSEAGATTTTMSWTSGTGTNHALLAVSYNPR